MGRFVVLVPLVCAGQKGEEGELFGAVNLFTLNLQGITREIESREEERAETARLYFIRKCQTQDGALGLQDSKMLQELLELNAGGAAATGAFPDNR